ncbi:MAG: hypothetical protein HC850_12220 [Rhodomicrobium sp.]|nr:hypothetical protein [Rhodomicrobium sp.]
MRVFGKVFASALALSFAGVLTVAAAQAAPVVGKPSVSSQIELVAKKKKSKKAGPGRCGTMKYWDKKAKKCADARMKKK